MDLGDIREFIRSQRASLEAEKRTFGSEKPISLQNRYTPPPEDDDPVQVRQLINCRRRSFIRTHGNLLINIDDLQYLHIIKSQLIDND